MDQSVSNEGINLVETSRRWYQPSSIFIRTGVILTSLYVFLSISIPVLLLFYPSIAKQVVFMNMMKSKANFTDMDGFGIDRVYNFYLNMESNVTLGVWHFRSPLIQDQYFHDDEDYFQKHIVSTPSTIPIIIYFHEYAYDRSIESRRLLCKRLRDELKYDVITFDYRGFGDSTGEPTEESMTKDSRFIYDWLQKLSNGKRKIYLWGHSLGSSVACQLAAKLSKGKYKNLGGIVMEAPFLNIHQALLTHWFSIFFRWQPWYYSLTEKALYQNKILFDTRTHIANLNCPCILLHADDDLTIPYIHSKQLLQLGLNIRNDNRQKKKNYDFNIEMISFHRTGYGHKLIYQAPKLISALKRVIFEEDL